MSDDDNVFARWSRRKLRTEPEPPAPLPPAAKAELPAEPETEEDESELLRRLDLPLPESLKAGDDFSAFMRAGVPGFLRKRALRVLWRSNPVLANLDGLNDYDDDFNSPELTKKILATGYQVGRGFLRDEPPAEDTHESGTAKVAAAADEPVATGEGLDAGDAAIPGPETGDEVAATSAEEPDIAFRPRRMRFET